MKQLQNNHKTTHKTVYKTTQFVRESAIFYKRVLAINKSMYFFAKQIKLAYFCIKVTFNY